MEIKIEEVRKNMKKYGYFATEELEHSAFLGLLNFEKGKRHAGQDIYAVCLEGPPGAGKTEYAKVYTKLVKEIWNGNALMVDYQCDATTGKTELFEDINISAVIKGDVDNVNIPGKLIEAIKLVNAGKKVVLFIDEYDKAKEETDAFLLQFLQSGKVNSTQHGDMEIKEDCKHNLQVILCKNDARETLSGPLSRRLKIIRLDYMKPDDFYAVATRKLVDERPDNKVNVSLIDFVSLIYNDVYKQKDEYLRLPACSEMLMAIEEADDLQKFAHATDHLIYRTVLENLFKDKVDLDTFESKMKSSRSDLAKLIKEMTADTPENAETQTLQDLILKHVLKDQVRKVEEQKSILAQKIAQVGGFLEDQRKRFDDLEASRRDAISKEQTKIALGDQTALVKTSTPKVLSNFSDSTPSIRRGESVFSVSDENWTPYFGTTLTNEEHEDFARKMRNLSQDNTGIIMFEDGYLISYHQDNDFKAVLVREQKEDEIWLKFYANSFAVTANMFAATHSVAEFLQNPQNEHRFDTCGLIYSKKPIEGLLPVKGNLFKVATDETKSAKETADGLKSLSQRIQTSQQEDLTKEVLSLSRDLSNGGGK